MIRGMQAPSTARTIRFCPFANSPDGTLIDSGAPVPITETPEKAPLTKTS